MKPTIFLFRWTTAALVACWWLTTANRLDAIEPLAVCSPDETHVASVAEQGRIHYRRASDNTVEHTFYICHPQAICFSANGKLLAAAGGANGSRAKIKVWRLSDHQPIGEIIMAGEGVNALALSADGSLVAGATADGRVEVWRVSDGQSQWSRTVVGAAKSIRFSPDSRRLLIRAENGTERQFEAGNGRPVTAD